MAMARSSSLTRTRPRSQSMFGSLVVVFPTPHEGGALVLRHDEKMFTFDATALLSWRTSSIAYAAFFSDVEHEVTPVVSGHRVTLTYNLYYGARRNTAPPSNLETLQPLHASVPAVKEVLTSLLDGATFMPQGGTLGFGLRRHYPFPKSWTPDTVEDPLASLEEWLKGSDAALFQACSELGVSPDLRLVSKGLEGEIMLQYMADFGIHIEDAESELFDRHHGILLRSFVFTRDASDPWYDMRVEREEWHRTFRWKKKQTVYWLTRSNDGPAAPYAAYGNEAALEWLYMRVGLLVTIGPHGRRTEEREVEPEKDVEDDASEE